ncbi:hypothetical protein HMPREF1254_1093 [Prevotella sp. BV3P1]|nr:hypothetical protein HMPREF1254_1093 [Prevotella sp. BV3P1]
MGWLVNKNKHIFRDKRKIATFFKTIKNFVFSFLSSKPSAPKAISAEK